MKSEKPEHYNFIKINAGSCFFIGRK